MDEHQAASIDFVKEELLPEAVHNRCFCKADSREFVEFASAMVEPMDSKPKDNGTEYYRARLSIRFSGEATSFMLIVKLLSDVDSNSRAYDKFMNEEMFYNKMTSKYNLKIFPKCYVADMGRYGRPVIILEDLESCGYVGVDSGKLDEHHLGLCLRAIGRFHQRGLRLKAENFNSFREFYVKLIDTRLDRELSESVFSPEGTTRIFDILKKLGYIGQAEIESEENGEHVTICHGKLAQKSFIFLYKEGKPVDVKVIGWNGMRYCSIVFDLVNILQDNLAKDDVLERLLASYVEAAS